MALLAIFTGEVSLVSVFTTLTMTLADMYSFNASTAYFFFVALEFGFTVGNLMVTFRPQMASKAAIILKTSLWLEVLGTGLLACGSFL